MQFLNILAALALITAVTALPASNPGDFTTVPGATRGDFINEGSALDTRASLDKRSDTLTISSSNACISTGGGFPSCSTGSYIHVGKGDGDCDDPPAAFDEDFCSTQSTIETPAGEAKWKAAKGCSDAAKDGADMGTLTAGKTVYKCVKKQKSFSLWCGSTGANLVHMVCKN